MGVSLNALRDSPSPALVLSAYYSTVSTLELAVAYSNVAKGLAVFEETPRGSRGAALREHLNIIVAEQKSRGEVAA